MNILVVVLSVPPDVFPGENCGDCLKLVLIRGFPELLLRDAACSLWDGARACFPREAVQTPSASPRGL